jgi:mRNA-degrading endonuclease RelE of RelBE toxin-antitoxin system
MTYKISPTKQFESDFYKLDKATQIRITKKTDEVAENPERYKHLHFSFKGSCRIRIGKLRVIYSYNVKKQELYPEQIVFGHKY